MIKKKQKEESQWIREIAYIMARNQGPFTKLMLANELQLIHPDTSLHELKNEISMAFLDDRFFNKPPRFKHVKPGWWDLATSSQSQ